MTQQEFAKIQLAKITELKEKVQNAFYFLEAEELNTQPSSGGWSILQCIEHINLTNAFYLKGMKSTIAKAPDANRKNARVSHGFFGKMMIKSMQPSEGKIRFKMKTFKKLKPLNELDPKARLLERVVFEKFMEDMNLMTDLVEKSIDKDWRKIKIYSFLGKMVSFNLGDAFSFVNAHTERHITQALNVLEHKP